MAQIPVPKELWHRDRLGWNSRRERPSERPLYGLNSSSGSDIDAAVVFLSFIRNHEEKVGNGFFVNVPGSKTHVVFTAGHNLIDEDGNRSDNLKAWWQPRQGWLEINPKDVHISEAYEKNPTPSSAVNDYGVIMIEKSREIDAPAAFGFALALSEQDSLEPTLSITSYKAGGRPGDIMNPPKLSTSSAQCMNPILSKSQLEYKIPTEAGMSGSAVWIGYKNKPTVVAIHNYAPLRKGPKYGSRGTRINFPVLREIFKWAGVFQEDKRITVQAPKVPKVPAPQFPLRLVHSPDDHLIRVVVSDPDDDRTALERFDILPVYATPLSQSKSGEVSFGFRQLDANQKARWISWDVEWDVATMASALNRAHLGRWVLNPKTGKATVMVNWRDGVYELIVRVDSAVVKQSDMEFPGAEYNGVAFKTKGGGGLKKPYYASAYSQFVLE